MQGKVASGMNGLQVDVDNTHVQRWWRSASGRMSFVEVQPLHNAGITEDEVKPTLAAEDTVESRGQLVVDGGVDFVEFDCC